MTGRPAPAPARREVPGLDLGRLRAYLDRERPGLLTGELAAELIPGGRSNLTYRLRDGRRDWVLRRPPLGHVLATAHDMGREHRVLTGLAGSPVPVPRPVLLCADPEVIGAPFYVMERVDGVVYRDAEQTARLSAGARDRIATELVAVLARLHALDPAAYGLADFGRPEGFLARQVRRWRTQLDGSRSRDVPGIDVLADALGGDLPTTQRATIVHGDYRLDNVIVGSGERIAAVLDWEMSTLGDPLTDLGLLGVYWSGGSRIGAGGDGPLGGLEFAEVADRYARRSDLDLTPLPWYLAFGYFKLAVILEGIHYRYVTGKTVGEGFDAVGAAVAPLVDRGLAALAREG